MRTTPAPSAPSAPRPGRHRPRSLRSRMILSSSLLLAALSVVIITITGLAMRTYLMTGLDQRLDALAEHSAAARGQIGAPTSGLPYLRAFGVPAGTIGVSVSGRRGAVRHAAVVDDAGQLTAPTAAQRRILATVEADGHHRTLDLPGRGGYRAKAVRADSRDAEITIVTAVPVRPVNQMLGRLLAVESAVAAAALAVAALVAATVIGRQLRPLQRVAATATRISREPLGHGEVRSLERVPEADCATETGRLAEAVNRLLGHVENALADRYATELRMRDFLADAGHELRTPLASVAGHLQLVRRAPRTAAPQADYALGRMESGIGRMRTLVEDLLLLARLDTGRPLAREEVGLGPLLAEAVADARAAGPDHRWEFLMPGELVLVEGDPDRLHQVVANLLANARTHTPPGTRVTVTVRTDAGQAVIRVADDGPGIPPDLLPRVFERFARGDASRSRATGSSGLGLAIVTAVSTAHGGRAEVTSEPGRTVFTIRLPLCCPAHTSAVHPPRKPVGHELPSG
ncbi:sensor histidine kinase [Streptomyces sp. NPDC048288]|uniref:sensor histidine kinase n=1 Tax=Streptomyces sp. NPDC048288 TaxID=3365529 RepID=UPI003716E666